MTTATLYGLVGIGLFLIGLDALIRHAHLLRKVLAFNVMSGGVFLVIAALAKPGADGAPDPVPHALVITGIVVSVAATGFALVLMLRVVSATGHARLPHPRSE